MSTGDEIALLDLRSEEAYAAGHPLFAASMPLESPVADVRVLLPRREAPIVVYGSDATDPEEAIARLRSLGYTDVAHLAGGLDGWRASGGEMFENVNAPSKAFGELVEIHCRTPSLPAREVAALLEAGADMAVIDVRRPDEYQTMAVPTAVNIPGGELVYRFAATVPRPETLVVVHCAGRTRSIIGAQSLINAGVPNRVVTLGNGTIGWTLAGLPLEYGNSPGMPTPDPRSAAVAAAAARSVADRTGVRHLDFSDLDRLVAQESRTFYRFDVRTEEEHLGGHPEGFRHAPGGQLVQETDAFAPVRGAVIVLFDDQGTRADMTASWLTQMNWEVVVTDGPAVTLATGRTPSAATTVTASIQSSADKRAAQDIRPRYRRPYEGTDVPATAMQAYLDWEAGLVDQLERDGTHGFKVWIPKPN